MVSVELPSSRRKRDTSDTALAYGYEISLSNDRLSFGESVNIIIYDESCYTCNSTSVASTMYNSVRPKHISKHVLLNMKQNRTKGKKNNIVLMVFECIC
jgi:hypothetical protein